MGRPPSATPSQKTLRNQRYLAKKAAKKSVQDALSAFPELREELAQSDPVESALGKAVIAVYQDLPRSSPFRKPLIGALVERAPNIPRSKLAKKLNVLCSSVDRAVKHTKEFNFLLRTKAMPHATREALSEEDLRAIKEFWLEHTVAIPWKSVSKKKRKQEPELHPYHEQRDTDDAIFKHFEASTGKKLCKATVVKHKPFNVKFAKQVRSFLFFFCRELFLIRLFL
jgi:hypothetical protein